ncbi:TolC family protein [Moorella sp. E306M]|uniref:TolC family protein n=1 Tax=Moorella sp. E306M TaxID=2572683 RepID=UPI00155AA0A0|nr:TolC family protein [Moorella sp. E306M]
MPDTLTLQQAVDMALKHSSELQVARNTIDKNKKLRDEAWDANNAVLINTYLGNGLYVSVPTGKDPQGAVFKTDYDWRAAQKDYDTKVESVKASVYQAYFNVLQDQAQVNYLEQSLASKERNLRDAEARWQAGMDTAFNVNQLRAAVVSERAKLAQAQDTLARDYANLAQLVGLPRGSTPALSNDATYQPLEVTDLNSTIEQIVSASPDLWKAQQQVQLIKDTFAMQNSADVDRYNLKNANLAVTITGDKLQQAVLKLYYTVKDLEAGYEAAQKSVATAEEALRLAKLRYDVGIGTQADVLAAEASLAQARQQLLSLTIQHELAVKAFWQPWAWSASGGSSAAVAAGSSGMGTGN